MKFDAKIWRNYYDNVQNLGQMVKDALPDHKGNKPVAPLDEEDIRNLNYEIKCLKRKCNAYLNSCNMKPRKPLWTYVHQDERTHASSEKFAYKHLLPSSCVTL